MVKSRFLTSTNRVLYVEPNRIRGANIHNSCVEHRRMQRIYTTKDRPCCVIAICRSVNPGYRLRLTQKCKSKHLLHIMIMRYVGHLRELFHVVRRTWDLSAFSENLNSIGLPPPLEPWTGKQEPNHGMIHVFMTVVDVLLHRPFLKYLSSAHAVPESLRQLWLNMGLRTSWCCSDYLSSDVALAPLYTLWCEWIRSQLRNILSQACSYASELAWSSSSNFWLLIWINTLV